jgi:hypothetical protein
VAELAARFEVHPHQNLRLEESAGTGGTQGVRQPSGTEQRRA